MPTATDLGCPTCAAGGTHERLMDMSPGYQCTKGHRFNDTAELYAMQPPRMPLPPKAPVRMLPGYVKAEICIPGNLKQALDAKFGIRLDATIVAICTTLMDPGAFVISSEDVGQMAKYFSGKNIRHGAELTGEVYSIFQERQNLKEQMEKKENVSFSGGLMVRPTPETLAALKKVASANGKSASQIAAECLETAVKNEWI
jgi:predicted HicB family RNase H-like nuclease